MNKEREFYDITQEAFVKIWTDSESLSEVVKRVSEHIKKPYANSLASAKASKLREAGVRLKKFKKGKKVKSVDHLNDIIKKRSAKKEE